MLNKDEIKKTPRRELKIQRTAEYFDEFRGVWK